MRKRDIVAELGELIELERPTTGTCDLRQPPTMERKQPKKILMYHDLPVSSRAS
jgi:hypothetical protein